MPRRFLTAEDVRRATARELLVDADTLVTPQAREEAAARGIVLRGPGGSGPPDPPPDRGPDAARAVQHSLPHLPEPTDPEVSGTGVVVTAVGRNRRGILAEITTTLNSNGGSVLSVSQRVVDGLFHLILMVELEAGAPFEQLKQTLQCLGGPDDYVVRVMHERVYLFMHRV